MADRQSKSKSKAKSKIDEMAVMSEAMEGVAKQETGSETKMTGGKWLGFGWALLLLGGLAHMLPEQMAPLLSYSMYGVTVQMAVGALSVIVALYFLMGE